VLKVSKMAETKIKANIGFASLVTTFAGSFTPAERIPLVHFLIIFPVLVLFIFTWLVSKHSGKLFAPSDFKDEENYVKMQLAAVASLTAASSKESGKTSEADIENIVKAVQQVTPKKREETLDWKSHVLWVDDRPNNNIYERHAFEALGIRFTLALSTNEALDVLKNNRFAAIISDMGRQEGQREGYVLLDAIRSQGNQTPFFIYTGYSHRDIRKKQENTVPKVLLITHRNFFKWSLRQ